MRETNLGDYLRVLRRGKLIIVLTAVVCAGIALAVSLLLKPTYQAESVLSVQDPDTSLALTGVGVAPATTPLQLALSYSSQVTRQEVLSSASATIGGGLTTDAIRKALSVSVDPNSALIDITASAPNADQAAAIANAVAAEDVRRTGSEARRQYALQARQVRRTLSAAAGSDPATRAAYLEQLFRLETLSAVAAPLQINTVARTPTGPTSPRPLRYTLAAFVFGLLLGLALAYGRERLDRRLRSTTDVEELLDYPIIGAISTDTLGRGGGMASASSNGTGTLRAQDLEAFRIVRQNFQYMAAEPLRSVLVTSAMAEEGKSTVAVGLAAALATAGRRTLLVDCDLRRPVVSRRLGLPPEPGLTDYVTGNAAMEDVVHQLHTLLPSLNGAGALSDQGLSCITAGTPAPRPAELLASDRFQRFLAELSHTYDTVVLDSAPLLTVADSLALVPAVASVLLCVRLLQTRRDHARAALHALGRLPERPMAVVLTGVKSEGDGYYYGYESYRAPAAPAARSAS